MDLPPIGSNKILEIHTESVSIVIKSKKTPCLCSRRNNNFL